MFYGINLLCQPRLAVRASVSVCVPVLGVFVCILYMYVLYGCVCVLCGYVVYVCMCV